jgi:hypothetical protein
MKKTKTSPFRFNEQRYTKESEIVYQQRVETYFERSVGTTYEKLHNFTKYVPTKELRKFLYRHEIYKQILDVHGSIVEAGVLYGGGLMTWAHFTEIYEPTHHLRKIIGFDTFEGFPSLSNKDNTKLSDHIRKGGYAVDTYEDLKECSDIFHSNCFLSHIPKVQLIRGDVSETLPKYLKENPHLVVSLLHLDMDLYEPTKVMLKHLLPRIPKGGIIAFDEMNQDAWQGETIAVMEEIGIPNLRLKRCSFGTTLSYAVME